MNVARVLVGGSLSVLLLFAAAVVGFGMGMELGYEAATNESVTYGNVSGTIDDVEHETSENMTAAVQENPTAGPFIYSSWKQVEMALYPPIYAGLEFGYNNSRLVPVARYSILINVYLGVIVGLFKMAERHGFVKQWRHP